ncbi:S8 family serine peptidase [Streptomyces solicathayae]|uniref:S8 family serine peptidase n=1 Tax=Streptomyces solicathayae TaxID=3081768 RepID=A0ABZ0M686_9ACTN|nr:S8 family serine peptidase [Streptomyces sp. HUAS YS2]WOX26593.1 S8 family serine peptidase [Streptomyces sp. HUAS YS2]
MQSDELWSVSTGRGITIAVLDTGVDSTVPELRGKVLPGRNVYDGQGPGRTGDGDTERHGTNMSLAIAGSGAEKGVNGISPGATILPVKVGDKHGFGTVRPTAIGIRYAVDHGARIINISMGGPARTTDRPQWRAAVNYALQRGALIFAGAGNDGTGDPQYPAAIPGVVAVGALEPDGTHASFSNHGDHLALAAPGVDMPGRCSADKTKYCAFDGTSHATAIASASAALIWSAHPDWTGNQVLRVMLQTAGHDGPVPSRYIGYGSVRPAQVLLEGKGDPGDPDVHPLLAAAQATAPSPAPQRTAGAPEPAPEPAPAPPRTTWRMPAIVVATALLLAALTTLAVLRRRRAHPPTPRSTT